MLSAVAIRSETGGLKGEEGEEGRERGKRGTLPSSKMFANCVAPVIEGNGMKDNLKRKIKGGKKKDKSPMTPSL